MTAAMQTNRILTKREFLKCFTAEEYSAIKVAAAANATLDYYWQMFMLSEDVHLGDTDTINGVTLLEQAGLIGTGRASEILSEPLAPVPIDVAAFTPTHHVDGAVVMVEPDGTVRYGNGKWTTLYTLASQGKTVEVI